MGDYFIWESRRRELSSALVSDFPPTFHEYGVSFLAGRRFLAPLPELEVCIGEGQPTDDLVIFKHRCLAHSQRLMAVLRDAGATALGSAARRRAARTAESCVTMSMQ